MTQEHKSAKGRLTFFCGKMGSGKTTLSKELANKDNTVLLSEDDWLESLYPGKITSLESYIEHSNLLKPQIKKLVQSILLIGSDVVMDFPANTQGQRLWFRGIFSEIGAPHTLIYLDLSNEACLKQIEKRRIEQPERAKTDTKEMFEAVTKYFVAPEANEQFNVVKHTESI